VRPVRAQTERAAVARWRRVGLSGALIGLLLAMVAPPLGAQARCRAVDGDTIRCGSERIRLRQIYAPEMSEPGGADARARLQRRLEEGEVRLERHGRDRYGRTRADVYIDGTRIEQRDIGPRGGRGAQPRGAR